MSKSIGYYIGKALEEITLNLSDYIISEVEEIDHERKRRAKYVNKILPFGARFVDTDLFTNKNEFNQRKNIIGYIGRLSKDKGVMNFIKAVPLILKENEQFEFLIGGTGALYNEIKIKVKMERHSKITLTGHIPHAKMPDYLNKLKLLVLPSEEEGLATIVLEAMACGTPVLATPVGAIPEVIKDGKTGFMLDNNSPECIADNVIKIFSNSKMEEIAHNAQNLIYRKYNYLAAVKRYRWMLDRIMEK